MNLAKTFTAHTHLTRWRTIASTALASLLPALAWAEEAAEKAGEAAEHDPTQWTLQIQGFYLIDFIAFVAIIIYAARKPLAAFLDKRYADVSKEIELAQAMQAEAQKKFDAYNLRMQNLATEMEQILSEARAGTQAEVKRILDDAHVQVERITAEERVRLEQESKRIRDTLQREAATLAVTLAEQMVRERLDPATQGLVQERALREIEQLPSA